MRYIVIGECLIGALLVIGFTDAAEWHTAVVDPAEYAGFCNSLALDSEDNPHIAYTYRIMAGQTGLKYAFWTGVGWDIDNVYDYADYYYLAPQSVSLALDSQNLPHIVFYTRDYHCYLKYAYWNGTEWEYQTICEEYLDNNEKNNSIAIDSQDHPHILYTSEEGLTYAQWTGTNWEIQVVDSEVTYNTSNSLALDSQDYPQMSYYVWNPFWDLRYAYWNGSQWAIQTIDPEFDAGLRTSMAIDSQDRPHISYYFLYPTSSSELRYALLNGSSWSIQVIDSGGDTGNFNSIALDAQDYPAIAYSHYTANLYYAHWNGNAWDIQQVTTGVDDAWMNSLAFNSDDYPLISYHDNGDSVLKIAWYGDAGEYPNTAVTLQDFSAQSNDDSSITLNWSVETTGDEQVLGYNLYRCSMQPQEQVGSIQSGLLQNWQRMNSALIVGRNPYVYIDDKAELGVRYEYHLEAVLADDSKTILGSCQATAELPNSFAITKVYPNPADSYLTCAFCVPETGNIDLAIYDLSGRSVLKQDLFASKEGAFDVQLDVGQLSPGLYTIMANQTGIITTAKLVVVR